MVKRHTYVPDRGDIVWADFDPQKGHEQARRRPAVVLSPKFYNERSQLTIVCPVTSKGKGYEFEVPIEGEKISGVILADQIRSMDWRVRRIIFIEKADSIVLAEIRNSLIQLLTEN